MREGECMGCGNGDEEDWIDFKDNKEVNNKCLLEALGNEGGGASSDFLLDLQD